MLGAERALAMKDYPTAETELTAALAAAPATWPRRPELLGSTDPDEGQARGLSPAASTSPTSTSTSSATPP